VLILLDIWNVAMSVVKLLMRKCFLVHSSLHTSKLHIPNGMHNCATTVPVDTVCGMETFLGGIRPFVANDK
jgi:hypothetical protein